jgi:hypothetical protein
LWRGGRGEQKFQLLLLAVAFLAVLALALGAGTDFFYV